MAKVGLEWKPVWRPVLKSWVFRPFLAQLQLPTPQKLSFFDHFWPNLRCPNLKSWVSDHFWPNFCCPHLKDWVFRPNLAQLQLSTPQRLSFPTIFAQLLRPNTVQNSVLTHGKVGLEWNPVWSSVPTHGRVGFDWNKVQGSVLPHGKVCHDWNSVQSSVLNLVKFGHEWKPVWSSVLNHGKVVMIGTQTKAQF